MSDDSPLFDACPESPAGQEAHTEFKKIRFAAMDLLSRREHSRKELRQKLAKRFDFPELIEQAIEELAQKGYQSDTRFAEAFVSSRCRRGQGPIRIAMELRERGIDSDTVALLIDSGDESWREMAIETRERRFGQSIPVDMKARAKQMRFLQYRGFTPDQVRAAIGR